MATRIFPASTGNAATIKVNLFDASTGKVWNGSGMVVFVQANQAATYDITVTETATGSGLYQYTVPAGLPNGTYLERPRFNDTDAYIATASSQFTKAGNIVPAFTGTGSMTIDQAIDLMVRAGRSAGEDLSDDEIYDLTDKHNAIMRLGIDFQEDTKYAKSLDTVDIAEDENTIDFSGVTGFTSERFITAWIDDQYPISKNSSADRIAELRRQRTTSGAPTLMAFDGPDSAVTLEDADDDYTINFFWTVPFTSWTAGDTGVGSTILNLPSYILRQIIPDAGAAFLQFPEQEEIRSTLPKYQRYLQLRNSLRGSGQLDIGPTRKMTETEMYQRQLAQKNRR